MKTIGKLWDLKDYGIFPLTGEACGVNMRVLCDFSERGRKIIGSYLGDAAFKGATPWNNSTDGHAHVGSIMLDPDLYISLGVFALLESGYKEVYRCFPQAGHRQLWVASASELYGFTSSEQEECKEWRDLVRKGGWSLRCYAYAGTAGSRNQHVFTGRVS